MKKNENSSMEQYIEKYIAREKIRKDKIKKMMSSTDYIEWLIKFTQDKESFSDENWLYCPDKITEIDRQNVSDLALLYEGISEYAKDNFIYPVSCKFGHFYRIKLNDFCFEIGMLKGQGMLFYFRKLSYDKELYYIDFNDIINKKRQDNVRQINTILGNISNTIRSAYESGVPIEAIIDVVDGTISNINMEDKPMTLKKCRNSED